MKRLTLLFLTLALCLGALTSCNLERVGTYSYSNEVILQIENQEDYAAVEEYMKTNFVEITNNPTFTGPIHDAITKFTKHFVEEEQRVDHDFIYSHLKESSDGVRLIGFLSGPNTKEWVGYSTYTLMDLDN